MAERSPRTDETTGKDRETTPNIRRIRSPEAVAVALTYEHDGSTPGEGPPTVVAGGRGAIAEQIIEMALAQGIKVREDADLANLLSTIDIDSEIPPEAFAAVAEILIYVYRANGNLPDFLKTPDIGKGATP